MSDAAEIVAAPTAAASVALGVAVARDEVPAGARGRWRRRVGRAGLAIAVCSVAAFAVRLVARDDGVLSRWVFFLPPLLVGPAALVGASLAPISRAWRVLLAVAVIAAWLPNLAADQPLLWRGPQTRAGQPGDLTILQWNVMSYNVRTARMLAFIEETAPHVIVLNEGTNKGEVPEFLSRRLPDYTWLTGRRIAFGTRFPVVAHDQLVDTPHLKLLRVVVDTPRGPLTVLAADINSPRSRLDAKAFGQLGGALATIDGPALLVGDFNVPRGSARLEAAVAGWTDAFAVAGAHRLLATWPSLPCALWQIDHAFCRGVEPVAARVGSVVASDHLPLVVTFRSAAPEPAAP